MTTPKNSTGRLLRTIVVHEYDNLVKVEHEERTGIPISRNLVAQGLRNAAGYIDKHTTDKKYGN